MTTRPRKRAAQPRPRAAASTTDPQPAEPMRSQYVEPVDELPPPTNVIEALARVELMMGGIEKLTPEQRRARGLGGSDDERGIKYAYRGIDQIEARVQALFGRYGIVTIPWEESYEVSEPFTMGQGASLWTDHRVTLLWTIHGPGGKDDWITARTSGLGRDNSDKGYNKACTGAAKNFLLKILHIGDPTDDPDNERHESTAPPRVDPPRADQDPRTPAEVAIRQFAAAMSPDQRKRFVESFVNQFGTRLLDLDPVKHGDALDWSKEWIGKDADRPAEGSTTPAETSNESTGTDQPDDAQKPLDGSDGGPGLAEPIEQPALGDALADGLHVDEPAPIVEPGDPPVKAAMPEGCDIVGTRCRAHRRPAAECRAQFGDAIDDIAEGTP